MMEPSEMNGIPICFWCQLIFAKREDRDDHFRQWHGGMPELSDMPREEGMRHLLGRLLWWKCDPSKPFFELDIEEACEILEPLLRIATGREKR